MSPRKLLESLRLALEGIAYCIRTQRNMRIHCVFALLAVIFGCLAGITRLEFIFIIIVISMVLICEVFNTAIEKAVDASIREYHPIAKLAKDVAAGAVLVSAINAVLVGCIIFGRYVWAAVLRIAGNGR
ncbi:MAG TPA: diacylglycerol kinase family protein [Clostridia bacterium]|nr:diacylglycerol kinase family protein [Clostridia bacterium]